MKYSAIILTFLAANSYGQFLSGEKKYPVTSEGSLADVLNQLQPRQLGPSNMSGRIMDLAVQESNANIFYVASASGGLWKTVNGGTTFECIFDYGGSVSMGSIGLSKSNPNVIYLGTGEQSSRNSVAWGDGVYKSIDAGKTWKHIGLTDTRHIGKVLVHPTNPDIAYVAAVGRLWGRSDERGVYKTVDGGKTWNLMFTQGNRAGVVDLDMDPKDPNTLYACAWDRIRAPFLFQSGGMDSGLFKSTDAGRTWRQLKNGLPSGDLGRIAVSIYAKDPSILLATVEYRVPGAPVRVSNSDDEEAMMEEQYAQQGGTPPPAAAAPKPQVPKKDEPKKPVVKPDPRMTQVSGTQMNGGGMFMSRDKGETWEFVRQHNPRPFYFSNPNFDPNDSKRIYIGGLNLQVTSDTGKTWATLSPNVLHADHHVMWINPKDSGHMITGCDGGVYQSRDWGKTWYHHNTLPLGQFYAASFDGQIPYWVYGGLQDNGAWALPTQHPRGYVNPIDAVNLNGGDGFYAEADRVESEWVYSESQGGAVQRTNRKTGARRGLRPSVAGETLRFNWNTPIHISPHDNKTIYIGTNRLMVSNNRGDSFRALSLDLTTMNPWKTKRRMDIAKIVSVNPEDTGAEAHCTIVTIDESPMVKGRIACGSDDGLVNVTSDNGQTWDDVTSNLPGLPKGLWISRVTWSKYQKDRLYVCVDGHRTNNFKPYLFVSEDAGKTFRSLANGLSDWDSLYVIREGEQNPNLLILGSEMSLRFSLDLGKTWSRIRGAFPTVAVHDVRVHPKMHDLVIATHGRAIWTLDISAMEGMTDGLPKKNTLLASSPGIRMPLGLGDALSGDQFYKSKNTQPMARIYYYLTDDVKDENTVSLSVEAPGMAELSIAGGADMKLKKGLNRYDWNPRVDGSVAAAGVYKVKLKIGNETLTGTVEVLETKSF